MLTPSTTLRAPCPTNLTYASRSVKAIKHYTEGIGLDAKHHVCYSNRSACYAALGKWDEALKDGEGCINANPGFAKGYSRKGLTVPALPPARFPLEPRFSFLPSRPRLDGGAVIVSGAALFGMGKLQEAHEAYSQGLEKLSSI